MTTATRDVISFCRICTAMCGIVVTIDGERVVRVRGDDNDPMSRGYVCPKGRALGVFHHHPRRLDIPLRRTASGDQPLDWPTASREIGGQLQRLIADHGPDSIAMYLASGSAFDTNGRRGAERFLQVIGSRQKYTATTIDTPCKPLVAELVGGWSGLTPVWDHEQSSLLLLIGTNPVVSHGHSNGIADPVRRLRELKQRGGSLVVIDPRSTETAALADLHLAPRPGTDHLLLAHLVRELVRDGADNAFLTAHTRDLDRLRAVVEPFDEAVTAARCDVAPAQLTALVAAARRAGRLSAFTGTGTSMSPAANLTEWMLWGLYAVTGSFDRRGGVWFNPGYFHQLDERDLRGMTGAEPGPASRPELPRRFGEYPCAALVSEIEAGHVRALFVVGGNPVVAFPDRERLVRALRTLELVVVVDVVETDTTPFGGYLLPAAGQLERADLNFAFDSYTLAVSAHHTPAVLPPAEQRRPVWRIFDDLATELGKSVLPRGLDADTANDEALLAQLSAKSRDPAAVTASPHGTIAGGAVYGWVLERVVPDGRLQLAPDALVAQWQQLQSVTAPTETLALIPQRQLRKMNSQLRDTAAPGGRLDDVAVVVNPADAAARGLADGAAAAVSSPIGSVVARVRTDERIRPGVISLAHGWAEPNVSVLTSADDVDPLTGMVVQSGLPVDLREVSAP